jgi:hypothetical protein
VRAAAVPGSTVGVAESPTNRKPDDAGSVALLDQAQPAESTGPVTTCARRSGDRLDLDSAAAESGTTGAGFPDLRAGMIIARVSTRTVST